MRISCISRSVAILILACGFPAMSPVAAAEKVVVEPPATTETAAQRLDRLFAGLKRERDPKSAGEIASQIRMEWSNSGSATIDLLMQWAETAVREKRNGAAFDFLDQVTLLRPDYVEGWNRRATLHHVLGEDRKSMADINKVLALEPRHFGALAGMAAILADAGKDALALKVWERFLEIYPANREAQEQVDTLSEKLAGSRT